VQAGVDLYRVKELMGHSVMAMTERYAHLAPENTLNAVRTLEATILSARQNNMEEDNVETKK
jgi:site-specific recombinase XerD